MNVHTKRVKRFLEQLPNKILVSKYRDLLGNYLEIKISENLTRFSYLEDRIMRKTTTEFNPKESNYKCSCNDTPYCKHIAIIVWLKILQWNLSENIYNLDMGLPIKKEFKPILEVVESFPSQAISRLFPENLGGLRFNWRQLWATQLNFPNINYQDYTIKLTERTPIPKKDSFVVKLLLAGGTLPEYLFWAIIRNLSPWCFSDKKAIQLPDGGWKLFGSHEINQVVKEQLGIKTVDALLPSNILPSVLQWYGYKIDEIKLPKLVPIVNPNQIKSGESFASLGNLNCEWRVMIGNDKMTPEEFSIYLEKTKWLTEFKQTQKILKAIKKPPKQISKFEAIRASILNEPLFLGQDMIKQFKQMLTQNSKLDIPIGKSVTLWEHQNKGIHWLFSRLKMGFNPVLADEMGLGKSLQMILTLQVLPKTKKQSLVVCPASVAYNWVNEFKKFAPKVTVGIWKSKWPNTQIVICSYGLCQSRSSELLKKKLHLLCLDEAQKIKNHRTKTRTSIMKVKAEYKVALTGTPIENKLHDLWSIFDVLMPGYLGTRSQFTKRFSKTPEMLAQAIKPFLLRRTKNILREKLPEKIINKVEVHLCPEQVALYQNVVQQSLHVIKGKERMTRKGRILAMITQLKQLCNHPQNYSEKLDKMPSTKTERLMHLMDASDEKTLIFTQFTKTGKILLEKLGGPSKCAYLHGGLSMEARNLEIEKFRTNPDVKAFILSIKAGGVGLNLEVAQRVIMYDLWWNPAVEDQAIDRAHRIGQTSTVNVFRMVCKGTFEEKIDQILENKRGVTNACLNQMKNIKITELTDSDLSNLFEWQG